jgi:hypothetical protein
MHSPSSAAFDTSIIVTEQIRQAALAKVLHPLQLLPQALDFEGPHAGYGAWVGNGSLERAEDVGNGMRGRLSNAV